MFSIPGKMWLLPLALTCLLLGPRGARADEKAPPAPARGWLDPLHYRDLARQKIQGLEKLEAVETLTAILSGKELGPGEGWFHPSQSRYDWKWLAARHHVSPKETISRAQFRGPAELFDRLDRNRDGVLSADDFDWSDASAYLRGAGMASRWSRAMDSNSNGRISRQEWDAFFEKAAGEKGYLTADDLQAALGLLGPPSGPPPGQGRPGQEPSKEMLLRGLLSGEIGSIFEGPGLGQRAPDFTLKTQDGSRTVHLADYRGKKPVVLVFGSFT